jgi:hypothetical protein
MQHGFYSVDEYMSFWDPLPLRLFVYYAHSLLSINNSQTRYYKSYMNMYVSILYYITVIQKQIKGIIDSVYVLLQRNVQCYIGNVDRD